MPYAMSFIFIIMSLGSMLFVGFKKWPCRHVDFKGPGPQKIGGADGGRGGGRSHVECQF